MLVNSVLAVHLVAVARVVMTAVAKISPLLGTGHLMQEGRHVAVAAIGVLNRTAGGLLMGVLLVGKAAIAKGGSHGCKKIMSEPMSSDWVLFIKNSLGNA